MRVIAVPSEIPFQLPAESLEIIIDLPIPTSTNRLHARAHGSHGRVYRTKEYETWRKNCDGYLLKWRSDRRMAGLEPRPHIAGPFEFCIYLARNGHNGDGDNRIKAALDWLQSVGMIRNDVDCQKGRWEWVPTADAPFGCRVHLRSLHE